MTPKVLAGWGKCGECVCARSEAQFTCSSAESALEHGQHRVDLQCGGQRFARLRIELVEGQVDAFEHRHARRDCVGQTFGALWADAANVEIQLLERRVGLQALADRDRPLVLEMELDLSTNVLSTLLTNCRAP